MGRKKKMDAGPRLKEFLIWWDTSEDFPMSAVVEAESEQDALRQAKEAAQRSNGKKYGVKKITQGQLESMMTRVCPHAAPAW